MPATSIEEKAAGGPPDRSEEGLLRSFLGELLAEQQRLDTPAARFSEAHDRGSPALADTYRDLIPLSRPGPGEQYAFEVELDACTGCKACVSACHSLNGLDDGETWRDTGLIVSPDPRHPFTQTVTTACHHCADPGCLNGCPVLAYEKDPATGIVRHLDDQCIGCSYCILKCPYDVPKYNPSRGIVRKCDLCHGRLEHGEAPACVQACPTHAIRIATVRVESGPKPRADTSHFLGIAPDPSITQPTTRYLSRRTLPEGLVAAEEQRLRPEPAHWPLAIALTLFGLAVGAGTAAAALGARASRPWPTGAAAGAHAFRSLALLSWLAGTAGLAASVFHLGRPLRAWKVFLGLRRSWLSREVIAFGAWWIAAAAATGTRASRPWIATNTGGQPALLWIAAALGAAGLFCSVMVYVDTRREFWRLSSTAPRFFGSALILGLAAAAGQAVGPAPGRRPGLQTSLALAGAAVLAVKLAVEALALKSLDDPKATSSAQRTARLLSGAPLAKIWRLRLGAAFAGAVTCLLCALGAAPRPACWLALAILLAGELAERHLFFRAVAAPRMPGVGAP